MAIKKSELYSSLWKSCDELRGGMDASQYKDYVLVLLFVKYVSDKYAANRAKALIDVPDGGGFADMVAAKHAADIGDRLNKIIARLAEANELKGVIDVADFNDENKLGKGQAMVDRLTKLVAIFETTGLDFTHNRVEGDDILGDAYEYLMRHFATESGKSKGQFYTPAEVSRIIAKVIGISDATQPSQALYDPTCGSGSLLLKAADEAPYSITIYGQEMDNATRGLARMNMILHNHATAEIYQGDTLADPQLTIAEGGLKTFDFVVANPPFSSKAWSNGIDPVHDRFGRFAEGIPPAKNGDYAFLLHVLHSLKATSGKGAIILPHGVLFRGNAEADIRRNLVDKGVIKGIIGLPPNLFYGTGIPACIIVLDRAGAYDRRGIFMIDASRGFAKDGNKNRLRHQDIHKIVDVFNRQLELPKYARMVSFDEIEANDYNLNIPRYIDSTAPEDIQDIEAHLRGGIPERDLAALNAYWQVFPSLADALFMPAERPRYHHLRVETAYIKTTIFEHPEFVAYIETIATLYEQWVALTRPRLQAIAIGDRPKRLIETIAEEVLAVFDNAALIDQYDVYQHLMTYWTDTMQDDVHLLVVDGWQATPDLIPADLIIRRYLSAEQQAISELEAQKEAITRQLEELDDAHGGEDGLLAEAKTEKGDLSQASIKARLKDIKDDPDADEERQHLLTYLEGLSQKGEVSKAIKAAQQALDAEVAATYTRLSEAETRTLLIDDKWLATIGGAVHSELDRVSQALARRIKQLAERYATPLPELEARAEALRAQVAEHLKRMGFSV